jgi:hypothetical protein
MMFSFDVVMIDKNFNVVSVKEFVKPFRIILPKLRAESVIELPTHTIFRSRTEVGDELVIERYEARKIPKPDGAGAFEQVVSESSRCLGTTQKSTRPAVAATASSQPERND